MSRGPPRATPTTRPVSGAPRPLSPPGSPASTPTAGSPPSGAPSTAVSTPRARCTSTTPAAACTPPARSRRTQTGSAAGCSATPTPTTRRRSASTELVERTRRRVLDFFNAPPDEYLCIFTANASGALRLVGESYPFAPGGAFALTFDNHNSVNGIREFARRKGAAIEYVPVVAPELRLDRAAMTRVLAAARPGGPQPARLPGPVELLRASSTRSTSWPRLRGTDGTSCSTPPRSPPRTGSTSAPCDPTSPSFSFYKMMGFPTGVGCLLARRDRVDALARPWFAGGTITIASVQGDGHYLHQDEAAFEDGTVDYLNLPAVADGLDHLERIGVDAIHERVRCLTAWLLDAMTGLRHRTGQPVVEVLGPTDTHGPRRDHHLPPARP